MFRYCVFVWLLLFISCKTKRAVTSYHADSNEFGERQISTIYIPIKLAKADVEKAINQQIGEVLFEEDNLNGDGVEVKASRTDSIRITLEDSTLLYRVPLHIWIRKRIAILGNTEAEGTLVLNFATNYRLREDWSIQTKTKIEDFEWEETPKISVLGASVPVSAIADRILLASKERITNEIDKLASEGLALKNYVNSTWQQIQQPLLVSEDYQSYLKITPSNIKITPFELQEDSIISTIFIRGLSEVSIGNQFSFAPDAPLPPLKVEEFEAEAIAVRLLSKIPFNELEKVALKNIKGESYEFGNKHVIVENLSLRKDGDKIAVDVEVSGDHDGMLYFKGIPNFNERKNQIDIKEVEFKLETKKFLLKTAKWLFTDLIINKIEANIQYSVEEDLEEIKKQIQDQLTSFEIQPGIHLKGQVTSFKVRDVGMTDTSVDATIELNGVAKIVAKGFSLGANGVKN